MKRLLFFPLVCAFFIHGLYAQNVDSIRVEQAGDLIKIHYKILNSNQYQIFNVAVSAKINGGLESKLESLIGDVGDAVKGGKNSYIVIWDVLKDVDEINSVDFSIRAELLRDESPKSLNWESKRFYILAAGAEGKGVSFGLRLAYMGSWGISGRYCFTGPTYSGFDLSKRIINKGGFQLHLIVGIANAYYGSTYGIGAIIAIKRVVFTYAGGPPLSSNTHPDTPSFSGNFGLGIRF